MTAGGRRRARARAARPPRRLDAIRDRCSAEVSQADHYADMRERGLQYGPYFQGVRQLWLGADGAEALARIEGHPALAQSGHGNLVHPSLLDACFQMLISGLRLCHDQNVYVPVSIGQVRVYGPLPESFWCHTERHYLRDHTLAGNVTLCGADGEVLVEVLNVHAQALTQKGQHDMSGLDQWLYQFDWEATAAPADVEGGGRWLLLGDDGACADALAARLHAAGADAVIMARGAAAFTRESASSYLLRTDSKEDMRRLLEASAAAPLRGIVHLWSLDAGLRDGDIGTANVVSVMHLVQEVAERGGAAPQLFFVTDRAQAVAPDQTSVAVAQAPVIGFVRVAINEYQELRLNLIDIDQHADTGAALAHEVLSSSREEEVALRAAGRFVARLARRSAEQLAGGGPVAATDDAGQEAPVAALWAGARRIPGALEAEIALEEVVLADGANAGLVGAEAFGVVAAVGSAVRNLQPGERVMLRLEGPPALFMTVPAAALLRGASAAGRHALQLSSFSAAYHALHHIARLKAGEQVLIQNAGRRLGQAALQVARALGATVYATAASAAERDLLRSLGQELVFDSSSTEFMDRIGALTGARGLDVVLNDGSGEIADKARALLGPFGRCIDTGVCGPAPVMGANQLRANMDIGQIMRLDPDLYSELATQVDSDLEAGRLQPLAVLLMPAAMYSEQPQAVAGTGQPGLLVLDCGDAAARIAADAGKGARFDADATYLITGGFGGFGLQMAAWMATQGVRHLVLVGRSGAATAQAQQAVADLEQAGVTVRAAALDIADAASVRGLLEALAADMPPLKGIFHAAAVLDDAAIKVLEPRKIAAVMQPKAMGAWLLHTHTRHLPLDYFVLFSSVGSLVGNPGQAPYVSANAFLDALALHRHRLKLSATAINWGALGEVGMAARTKGVEDYLNRMGFGSFTPAQAIGVLDKILDWRPVNVGAAIMDWQMLRASYPNWAQAPRNSRLFAATAAGDAALAEQSPLHALRALEPEQRRAALEEAVLDLVSSVLRVQRAKIDTDQSLLGLGMDSLMGIELQGALERRVGIKISTLELMKGNALSELVPQLERMVAAHAAPTPSIDEELAHISEERLFQDIQDLDAQLTALSDEEIEMALAELGANEEQA